MYPPHPLNQSNAKTSRDLDPRACARWSHSRIYLGSYLLFGLFSFDLINQRNYLGFGFFDAKMLKILKKAIVPFKLTQSATTAKIRIQG